jgi:hypothetical protein
MALITRTIMEAFHPRLWITLALMALNDRIALLLFFLWVIIVVLIAYYSVKRIPKDRP